MFMKNSFYIFATIFLCGALCIPCDGDAALRKKKKKHEQETSAAPVETSYDKLFKGKQTKRAEGLLKTYLVDGKTLYLEIPRELMEKDMLFYSTIDKSSDPGEGYIGDRSVASFVFRFVKNGDQVELQQLRNMPVSQDEHISASLRKSGVGIPLFSYPVKATSPDSALVIDATGLFMEESPYNNPFPANSANSGGGVMKQTSSYQQNKSRLVDVKGGKGYSSVQGELSYNMAGAFGGLSTKTRLLTIYASRHILLLPEQLMKERPADPRLNIRPMSTSLVPANSYIKDRHRAMCWNVERKPIVFYIDTLMPASWKEPICCGMEEWNKAFEAIGYKNVIQVKDMPSDSDFDVNDPFISVVRYAQNMTYGVNLSTTVDPRSGEIISASITIPCGLRDALQMRYNIVAMIHEPDVRQRVLPEKKFVDLLQATMADYMGMLLGFTANTTARHAYAPEDLRSPEFTREHGLFPSLVGNSSAFNIIAQPEDTKRGTLLMQKGIGAYDFFAVKCLYAPMEGCNTYTEKRARLDEWIDAVAHNPVYQFRQSQFADISSRPDGLGNDATKTLEYRLENLKLALANFMKWYSVGDEDMCMRERMYNLLRNAVWSSFDANDERIGGIVLNDDYALKNSLPACVVLPRIEQERAAKVHLQKLKDLSWMRVRDLDELCYWDFNVGKTFFSCFSRLFSRIPALLEANRMAENSKNVYPVEDYLRLLSNSVFEGSRANRKLTNMEEALQVDFIARVIASAGMNEYLGTPPSQPLLPGVTLTNQNVMKRMAEDAFFTPVVNRNGGESILAYHSRGNSFQRVDHAVAHIFFKHLKEIRTLVTHAEANSGGELKNIIAIVFF